MEFAGVSFSETDGQIFVRSEPAPERQLMDYAGLHTLLREAGYGDCRLNEDAIHQAVNNCNNQTPFVLLVAQRCDAAIQLKIAADDLSAELSLIPASGGKAATADDVMRVLTDAGVLIGIIDAAVLQACESGHCDGILVARGMLPENGRDAVFEEMIALAADRTPKLNESGLHDYREHSSIIVVQSGSPLMRRQPATAGVDGYSIRGGVLASRPGRDEPFATTLAGAEVASDDPNLLRASMTGQPVRVKYGVMVEPILRVAEVNMTTGNIHYDGTVHVDTDVLHGMTVQASGDIVVGGTVDGGLLEAGGNIKVAGGVIAHARLSAGGAISARFAEGAHISAGTLIELDDMALECDLVSLNQIIIGAGSPQRGRLIGGTTTAMMLIKVPILGSEKSTVSKLFLGVNPELDVKHAALLERIEKENVSEENLHKLVNQLISSGDPKGLLERVKVSRVQAFKVLGQSRVELDELDQLRALALNAKVEVGVGVAGAADLIFGKFTARLRQEFGPGTFCVNTFGAVVFLDITGHRVGVA